VHLIGVLLCLLLAACARSPVLAPETSRLPPQVELAQTPFFPQDEYQCGPAALATVLVQRGVDTDAIRLKPQVFIPEREGSLQVEMVAAARTHGMLVYPLVPKLDSILTEVAAGNPVLVLQNLGLDWYPQWHFAVVVGYDLEAQTLVLRSGTTRRWLTKFAAFDATWARGKRWAVLTLPPQRIPATAQAHTWLAAASDLEQTGQKDAALQAYRSATRHWPQEPMAWFALGNALYGKGEGDESAAALRRSVMLAPDFAAGWFNLSEVMGEQGCSAAGQARSCAAALAPEDARLQVPLSRPLGSAQCAALPACPAP